MKKTVLLAVMTLSLFSCKKDDNNGGEQAPQRLTLEKSAVTVKLTESAIVRITSGNGDYKVESADKSIATAAIEQTNVKITAVAEGQTTLTVADVKGQKATIAVTIESNIDPSERLSVENQEDLPEESYTIPDDDDDFEDDEEQKKSGFKSTFINSINSIKTFFNKQSEEK